MLLLLLLILLKLLVAVKTMLLLLEDVEFSSTLLGHAFSSVDLLLMLTEMFLERAAVELF